MIQVLLKLEAIKDQEVRSRIYGGLCEESLQAERTWINVQENEAQSLWKI